MSDGLIDVTKDAKYQNIRNKGYAVAGLALTGLVLFGVISEGEKEGAQAALESLVENGEAIAGIVVSAVAWVKSRTSKVSVVSFPMKELNLDE